ncbi:MAG: 2-C-methyl-D-erythritol 4-phosphate cytidylyltransferase [Clostridiales bacterium]|nr:2-C-methyl-D-erythritol 4-phosphate cytidylyltransferase [Clostridiales bacterium]
MLDGKKIGVVVLAAGKGRRMQSEIQKQYMTLAGRPLITYALSAFEESEADEIVLVVGGGEEDYVREVILRGKIPGKICAVTAGGKERYHSVYEGLKKLTNCDIVLIHDGARPLVDQAVIARTIRGALTDGACVAAMPVKDTIKVADDDSCAEVTLDRSRLWQIQTPQAFSYPLIREAYERMMADESLQKGITDDAMVVETILHCRVRLVEGSYENLKVTTPEDLVVAEALLHSRG